MELIYGVITTLITTIVGVIIGGFITIKVNNITNTKTLRKTHELSILQKVKELLQAWSEHLSIDVTNAFESKDINNFKTVSLCKELHTLIVIFKSNMSVLKEFNSHFDKLRSKELSLQLEQETLKTKLVTLANKYDILHAADLCEYTEGAKIWEDYAHKVLEINEGIDTLITLLDLYIEKNILNLKS